MNKKRSLSQPGASVTKEEEEPKEEKAKAPELVKCTLCPRVFPKRFVYTGRDGKTRSLCPTCDLQRTASLEVAKNKEKEACSLNGLGKTYCPDNELSVCSACKRDTCTDHLSTTTPTICLVCGFDAQKAKNDKRQEAETSASKRVKSGGCALRGLEDLYCNVDPLYKCRSCDRRACDGHMVFGELPRICQECRNRDTDSKFTFEGKSVVHCRDCSGKFVYDPDATRCPECKSWLCSPCMATRDNNGYCVKCCKSFCKSCAGTVQKSMCYDCTVGQGPAPLVAKPWTKCPVDNCTQEGERRVPAGGCLVCEAHMEQARTPGHPIHEKLRVRRRREISEAKSCEAEKEKEKEKEKETGTCMAWTAESDPCTAKSIETCKACKLRVCEAHAHVGWLSTIYCPACAVVCKAPHTVKYEKEHEKQQAEKEQAEAKEGKKKKERKQQEICGSQEKNPSNALCCGDVDYHCHSCELTLCELHTTFLPESPDRLVGGLRFAYCLGCSISEKTLHPSSRASTKDDAETTDEDAPDGKEEEQKGPFSFYAVDTKFEKKECTLSYALWIGGDRGSHTDCFTNRAKTEKRLHLQVGNVVRTEYMVEGSEDKHEGLFCITGFESFGPGQHKIKGTWLYSYDDLMKQYDENYPDEAKRANFLTFNDFLPGDYAHSDHADVIEIKSVLGISKEHTEPEFMYVRDPDAPDGGHKLRKLNNEPVQIGTKPDEDARKKNFRDFLLARPTSLWHTTYGSHLKEVMDAVVNGFHKDAAEALRPSLFQLEDGPLPLEGFRPAREKLGEGGNQTCFLCKKTKMCHYRVKVGDEYHPAGGTCWAAVRGVRNMMSLVRLGLKLGRNSALMDSVYARLEKATDNPRSKRWEDADIEGSDTSDEEE